MGKRTPKGYVLVFIILIAAAVVTYWVRAKPVKVLFSADLRALPSRIGPWVGEDQKISGEVKKGIDADSIIHRVYIADDPDEYRGVLVVYRKYGRRGFVHRPEMCYPAAGWEIVEKGYTTVPYDGKTVRARKVVAESGFDREVIVYWFASGERTEASFMNQQFQMALDRLKTQKYGWAFIRINAPVHSTDEETLAGIRDFLRSASDPLVRTLTRNK